MGTSPSATAPPPRSSSSLATATRPGPIFTTTSWQPPRSLPSIRTTANAFLRLSGANLTVAGIQTFAGTPVIENTESGLTPQSASYYASTLTINNATDDNLAAGSVIRDGSNTVTQQFASLALVKSGSGNLRTGILNNTGGIAINAGGIVLGASTTAPGPRAPPAARVSSISPPQGLSSTWNSFTARFDGLSGSGTIQNTSSQTNPTLAAPNLIIGDLDNTNMRTGVTTALTAAQTTWTGTIQDGPGTVGIFLQKVGHGTETFNSVQTFTKGLSIFGGTLALDFNANMATPTNIISPVFGTAGVTSALATTTSGSSTTVSRRFLAPWAWPSARASAAPGIPAGAYITAITGGHHHHDQQRHRHQYHERGPDVHGGAGDARWHPFDPGQCTGHHQPDLQRGLNVGLGASAVTVNPNTGSGTTLALGALSRPLNTSRSRTLQRHSSRMPMRPTAYATNFGVVNFGTTGTITTSTANNATGILGAYATYGGNDWATGGGTIAAYTGYTPSSTALTTSTTFNYNVLQASPVTVSTAATTVNTLHFADPSATAGTFTITSPGTLAINGSGILVSSAVGAAAQTITGTGTLSAGNTPGASDLDRQQQQRDTSR